jgi:hypothetical protein
MATALSRKLQDITDAFDLSNEEVGYLVGTSARSVSRWSSGEVTPHRPTQYRLLELAFVAEAIGKVLRPEYARVWLYQPNPYLDGDTPAQRISSGEFRSVLGLIKALDDGVFM